MGRITSHQGDITKDSGAAAPLSEHPDVEEARFWLSGADAYRAFEAAL